jgi:hypothetical protein
MEEHVIVDSSFSAIINAPLEQLDIPLKSKVQKAIHAAQKADPAAARSNSILISALATTTSGRQNNQ